MHDFLAKHRQRAVLADVSGVELVLSVDHPKNDHLVFVVQEVAVFLKESDGFRSPRLDLHQCDFFHMWVGQARLGAEYGGQGAVRLTQGLDQEAFAHFVQSPGKDGRRRFALRGDGIAIQFHEKLVYEFPIGFVEAVVVGSEFAGFEPEAFELRVQVRGKGGVDAREIKLTVPVQGQDVGAVHVAQVPDKQGVRCNV